MDGLIIDDEGYFEDAESDDGSSSELDDDADSEPEVIMTVVGSAVPPTPWTLQIPLQSIKIYLHVDFITDNIKFGKSLLHMTIKYPNSL